MTQILRNEISHMNSLGTSDTRTHTSFSERSLCFTSNPKPQRWSLKLSPAYINRAPGSLTLLQQKHSKSAFCKELQMSRTYDMSTCIGPTCQFFIYTENDKNISVILLSYPKYISS